MSIIEQKIQAGLRAYQAYVETKMQTDAAESLTNNEGSKKKSVETKIVEKEVEKKTYTDEQLSELKGKKLEEFLVECAKYGDFTNFKRLIDTKKDCFIGAGATNVYKIAAQYNQSAFLDQCVYHLVPAQKANKLRREDAVVFEVFFWHQHELMDQMRKQKQEESLPKDGPRPVQWDKEIGGNESIALLVEIGNKKGTIGHITELSKIRYGANNDYRNKIIPWGKGFQLWAQQMEYFLQDPQLSTEAMNRLVNITMQELKKFSWKEPDYYWSKEYYTHPKDFISMSMDDLIKQALNNPVLEEKMGLLKKVSEISKTYELDIRNESLISVMDFVAPVNKNAKPSVRKVNAGIEPVADWLVQEVIKKQQNEVKKTENLSRYENQQRRREHFFEEQLYQVLFDLPVEQVIEYFKKGFKIKNYQQEITETSNWHNSIETYNGFLSALLTHPKASLLEPLVFIAAQLDPIDLSDSRYQKELANLGVGQIIELADKLNIQLDTLDELGECLLHKFVVMNVSSTSSFKAGWSTLLKKFPHWQGLQNKAGQSAQEWQLKQVSDNALKNYFLNKVANAEEATLKKVIKVSKISDSVKSKVQGMSL